MSGDLRFNRRNNIDSQDKMEAGQTTPIKIGICGAGSIGREFSLKYLCSNPAVVVVAVVDLHLEAAEALARDLRLRQAGAPVVGGKYRETVDATFSPPAESLRVAPSVVAVDSMHDVFNLVDAFYIATPPSTHLSCLSIALGAKKHVIIEKPLAISERECDDMCSLAQAAFAADKLVTAVHIGMRCNDAVVQARAALNARAAVVREMRLRLLFRQWPREWQQQPWVAGRAEGGPLLEVGTHWAAAMLELVGYDSTVTDSNCTIEYPDGPTGTRCERKCSGQLTFSSGMVVSVEVDTNSSAAIAADRDIYELDICAIPGGAPELVMYDFVKLRDGASGSDIATTGLYGRQECVDSFVRSVQSGGIVENDVVTCDHARRVQAIIERILSRH